MFPFALQSYFDTAYFVYNYKMGEEPEVCRVMDERSSNEAESHVSQSVMYDVASQWAKKREGGVQMYSFLRSQERHANKKERNVDW